MCECMHVCVFYTIHKNQVMFSDYSNKFLPNRLYCHSREGATGIVCCTNSSPTTIDPSFISYAIFILLTLVMQSTETLEEQLITGLLD